MPGLPLDDWLCQSFISFPLRVDIVHDAVVCGNAIPKTVQKISSFSRILIKITTYLVFVNKCVCKSRRGPYCILYFTNVYFCTG